MPTAERRVAAQIAAIELAPVRPERRSVEVFNNTETSILTVRLGAKPTATAFTTKLLPQGHRAFVGTPDSVYGSWSLAEGDGMVTEHL